LSSLLKEKLSKINQIDLGRNNIDDNVGMLSSRSDTKRLTARGISAFGGAGGSIAGSALMNRSVKEALINVE
jgi:hypothetical protein